ncbi:MAG: hypothetical protein M5T52_19460 [Ignavibacteriaceae bacterium]|nr:hypothetical protein [Ignavibacteriaceae bacterium]
MYPSKVAVPPTDHSYKVAPLLKYILLLLISNAAPQTCVPLKADSQLLVVTSPTYDETVTSSTPMKSG